jgi:hypothetical protein
MHQLHSPADDHQSVRTVSESQTAIATLLIQGSAGALVATLIAAALARGLFPPDSVPTTAPDGFLSWTAGGFRLEPREKGFYLLALLLGPTGAFLASHRLFRGDISYIAVLLVAALPPASLYFRSVLQGNMPAWAGLLVSVALAATYLALIAKRGANASRQFSSASIEVKLRPIVCLLIFGLLALVLVPSSFQAVAARIGMEMHVVSFLVGPSLYFMGHGLLPGVDYYAQYGVGLGWIFSFLIGKTAESTITNYVVLMVVALWLFFAHLVWILNWLYRSWFAAAVVCLLVLALLFHTDKNFADPSSYVLRYPVLTICAALLARWGAAPRDWTRLLSLSFALALAVFVETETGVVMATSIVLSFLLASPFAISNFALLAALGASSFVFFAALILLVFGPHALTDQFVIGLIEPLTIYGVAGYGAYPIVWTLREWNWLYNLVAPGIALATIGIMPRFVRGGLIDRQRAALVVYFSACGLLMSAKFINMSVIAVWLVNALGFLVVLGWWATTVVRTVPKRLVGSKQTVPARAFVSALIVIFAVTLASAASDRNSTLYGLRSWTRYPSILIYPFRHPDGCTNMSCILNRPNQQDVALISQRTKPGEQVAIVGDLYDWTYLINAHRPPLMMFLPSVTIFTKRQLDESWKRMATAEYWFVPKGADGKPRIDNVNLAPLVLPALEQDFVLDGVGDRLMAWKRKGR